MALYNAAGTLLTSTTVTDTDPLVDGYHWATTAPATVIAGDVYTVVTQTYGDNYSSGNAGTDNWATLTGTTYLYAPALGDPPHKLLSLLGWCVLRRKCDDCDAGGRRVHVVSAACWRLVLRSIAFNLAGVWPFG